MIPLDLPETHARILKHSPNGKVPALIDGPITVWESLSVIEYVAETHPGEGDLAARQGGARPCAFARRRDARRLPGAAAGLSGQLSPPVRKIALSEAVEADVARIEAAWAHARKTFGKAGPFLFGRFSAADAMFAPVVNRFHIYDVPVSRRTRDYMAAVMALPAWKAWVADAEAEEWRIEKYDAI